MDQIKRDCVNFAVNLEKRWVKSMAPDVGFEPTTKRLTAAYSTAELIWNFAQKIKRNFSVFFVKSQVK